MSHWHKWVPALLGFALSLALLAALWWCLRKWQIMVTRVNQFQHMSIFHHFNRGVTSDMKAHERMSMMSLLVASVSSSSSCCGKEHSSETSRSSRLKEWDFLSEKALSKEASCWYFVRISSVFATIFSQSGNSWRRPLEPFCILFPCIHGIRYSMWMCTLLECLREEEAGRWASAWVGENTAEWRMNVVTSSREVPRPFLHRRTATVRVIW